MFHVTSAWFYVALATAPAADEQVGETKTFERPSRSELLAHQEGFEQAERKRDAKRYASLNCRDPGSLTRVLRARCKRIGRRLLMSTKATEEIVASRAQQLVAAAKLVKGARSEDPATVAAELKAAEKEVGRTQVDAADKRAVARVMMEAARGAPGTDAAKRAVEAEDAARAAEEQARAAVTDLTTKRQEYQATAFVASANAALAAEQAAQGARPEEKAEKKAEAAATLAQAEKLGHEVTAAGVVEEPGAEEAAGGEKDERTPAAKELDRLKAGKLVQWGITGGVAPAFYQPLPYAAGAPSVPGAGALTYVLFLPGYWRPDPETNVYCANQWSGEKSEDAAARAADDLARTRAELLVDRLLAQERSGSFRAGDAAELLCAGTECVKDEVQIRELARTANGGGEAASAARTALAGIVQRTTFGWRSGISGRCRSRKWGVWFGYPLKYTATVPYRVEREGGGMVPKIERASLDVTPIFASGLGFSPNAYVSILAGLAVGKTNLPPGTDRDEEPVLSFVLGLGGNLDLLGFLVK